VEYWSVDVRVTPEDEEAPFLARLIEVPQGKLAASPDKKGITLSTEADAARHADRLREAGYRVLEVREKEIKRTPAAPFTTSTLQQEAARKLGFGARRTMRVAQQLYEGIDLPGEGRMGLITYMRTDSKTIAESALREIAEVVRAEFGAAYTLKQPRRYKTKQRGAQEAHEAIRPTSAMRSPDRVAGALDKGQLALYRLIWQRTVASQMAEARFDQVSVDVEATAGDDRYLLRATGQTMKFDGFRRVYFEGRDDAADEDSESALPRLLAQQVLRLLEVLPEQHFTQPPPRFTEASLVKALEELGIGRPSTYASIIWTLQERGYVRLEDKRFFPEDVGEVVTDLLIEFFPDVVDVNFTAKLEEDLDQIAEGAMGWVQVLDEFYGPFERLLEKNEEEIQRFEEVLDERCPLCPQEGREPGPLVIKLGRYGKFIGCSNWPDCSYIRNLDGQVRKEPEILEETCPECGRPLAKKSGRFGPFVGCTGYPECKYIKKEEQKTGVKCPKCGQGDLVVKRARRGKRGSVFYGCNRYPDCDFTVGQRPVLEPCPNCGSLMVQQKDGSTKCTSCGTIVGAVAESAAEG
ncbi:MAG TPA: type I DNA topoisomerase, partial [Actinomycetota bacterium]|nr:type I DNA topoisomerase [Actinomycetota bacterium]